MHQVNLLQIIHQPHCKHNISILLQLGRVSVVWRCLEVPYRCLHPPNMLILYLVAPPSNSISSPFTFTCTCSAQQHSPPFSLHFSHDCNPLCLRASSGLCLVPASVLPTGRPALMRASSARARVRLAILTSGPTQIDLELQNRLRFSTTCNNTNSRQI